jgi:outer membrane lipoprotein carrier protein
MKGRLLALGLLCLQPMSLLASAASDLSQLLSGCKTYQASFAQKTYGSQGAVMSEAQGKFYLARPNKYRWDTTKPNSQIIIGDGKYMWVYDVDLMQATKQSIQTAHLSPAQILSGDDAQWQSLFVISQKRSAGERVFHLSAKSKQQLFRQVDIYFKGQVLQKMQVLNNLSQATVFAFSKIQLNQPIASTLFVFKPGADVQIINSQS